MLDMIKDLSSSAIIRNSNDLNSSSSVNFINTLDVNYLIECIESYRELNGTVEIHHFRDLLSEALVRVWDGKDLNAKAEIYNFVDLVSRAYRANDYDLSSKVNVPDSNIIDIVYKLIQAPVEVLSCITIQDAYIRESRPTMNYGTSQSLIVGNIVDGSYVSVIQINTQEIYNLSNVNILKGELVLYLNGNLDLQDIVEIYAFDNNWNENTISWSNFIPENARLINSFVCDKSTVRINILDYILEAPKATINIYLKVKNSSNLIYFESSESLNLDKRPRIELSYQDLNWTGFLNQIELNSSATIRSINSRDLHSTLTIRNSSKSEMDSQTIVQLNTMKDINSKGVIRLSDKFDISSNANMLPGNNLDSSSIIRRNIDKDFISNSDIYNGFDFDSYVFVKTFYSWLNGKSIIRQNNNIDLASTVTIRNFNDIESNSITRLTNNLDKTSKAIIRINTSTNLDSKITIRNQNDLNSNSVIRLNNLLDLVSKVSAGIHTFSDLNSSIQVKQKFELNSKTTVQVTKNKDLNSYALTNYGTMLDSTAYVNPHIYDTQTELSSKMIVSTLYLTQTDLSSKGTVSTLYFTENDLNSKAVTRLSSLIDLVNSAIVYNNTNLNGKSIVRRTVLEDLISSGIIRQSDIDEIQSLAYLLGATILDLDSSVMVRRIEWDYLSSRATVQTNARQWIPNVHANDVFKYNDRKLPRVWKKENFIP